MHTTSGAVPQRGGVVTSQSPPFAVPMRYMMIGIACFGLFAIDLVGQSTGLARGAIGSPHIVAATHLLTLGALLSFVMGAVYQLSTVAFLIPLASVRAARWNFWLYCTALVGLFVAMAQWWSTGLLVFGSLMVAAIYIYAVNVLFSLSQSKIRGPMLGFVVSAHAYLLLAVSVAVLLVIATTGAVPGLNACMGALIATHILLAVGGFFTFLVMGFTFKLLPMFTLSHGFPTGRQKWTLTLAHVALWSLIVGVWAPGLGLVWAGGLIAIAALVSQLMDVRSIVKKRMRKKIEPPMRAAVTAVVSGILGLCLLLVQLVWRGQNGWQSVVLFYLLGAVTFMVMGFAYKIIPFLIWSKRYSKPSGNGKPILISDLINLNQTWPVLVAFGVGTIVLTVASGFGWSLGAVVGGGLIAVSILVFCVQLIRVINPKRVGKELLDRD